MRGSKPGERRGGRQKGTPNKVGRDVRELAREYTTEAITRLAHWMKSDDARASISACQILVEQGWGKPSQHSTSEVRVIRADQVSDDQLANIATRGSDRAIEAPADTAQLH
jgi:hypothetical protein